MTTTIRKPFTHTEVLFMVLDEAQKRGTDDLKARVTKRVSDFTGVPENKFSKRIKAWVHQYSMSITAGIPRKEFTGFLAQPVDLADIATMRKR